MILIRLSCRTAAGWFAILAAAPCANAQGSVTFYGIVDASVFYASKTLDPATGRTLGRQFSLQSAGEVSSSFGIRGNEDLGGGLAAIFALESGVNVANGGYIDSNGNFFGRQAWVGLTGGFGTVSAGLQYSPFLLSIFDTDARGLKLFGSGLVVYVDNVVVTGIFNANSIMYTSPEFAGFQGRAMMALGGTAGNFQAGRQYSGSLTYHMGNLVVSAAMYGGNAGGTAASTPVLSTAAFAGRNIGASYRFGKLTVTTAYTLYKVQGAIDSQVISGGFSYSVTPALLVDGGVWYSRDGNDSHNHSILGSVGTDYFLSKRTSLYAQFAYTSNHGHMNTGLAVNGAPFGVSGSQFAADVGIRHSF
ncbi:porin [Burkholderia sp. Bp9142]|nr:porin [Burkholderia sp. Bp9142]